MQNWNQLNTLDTLVVALCRDYTRRQVAVLNGLLPRRILTEYRYLNACIYEAVSEIVGERLAQLYITEIGCMTGYANSKITCMSEGMYKSYKRLITDNIAKKLHLSN